MSVNQKIIEALSSFGYPVVPDVYTCEDDTYFAFNYSTSPIFFSDDAPRIERYLIQVHLFCPIKKNIVLLRKQAKQKLFTLGFSWPEEINASDRNEQHYVFECEAVEGVE